MSNLPAEFSCRHRDPIASQAPKIARTSEHFTWLRDDACREMFRAKTSRVMKYIRNRARKKKRHR